MQEIASRLFCVLFFDLPKPNLWAFKERCSIFFIKIIKTMFGKKKEAVEKTDAEEKAMPPIPAPSAEKVPMKAKVWRGQPPVEVALHPSMVVMLRGIEAENARLQQQIDRNNHATIKALSAIVQHYGLTIDQEKAPRFKDADSDILLVPQPPKLEETAA